MAAPVRVPPGVMPPDEAYVRLRCPEARAVAVHHGDGSPPWWNVVRHPTRSVFVMGSGPTEEAAWKDAAARAKAAHLASPAP